MELLKECLADISIKCDKLLSTKQNGAKESCPANTSSVCVFDFALPVTTIAEVNKLNDVMSNKKQRHLLIDKILSIVGKNEGEVDGHYLNRVSDELITLHVLNSYTFKGTKLTFIKYTLIHMFFLQVFQNRVP